MVLKKRDARQRFQRDLVDGRRSRLALREPGRSAAGAGTVWTLFENGPPSQKVDLLVISEGYTARRCRSSTRDAERLVGALFATEPFKSRASDFNVRGARSAVGAERRATGRDARRSSAARRSRPSTTSSIPSATC